MLYILYVIFYQPLYNLLVLIYNLLPNHDLGLAIIILTLVVKAALFPISWKQIQSQKSLQDMQPKLDELKRKFKDDKQAQMQAQVQLFQEHKINPLSSCLPILIQLPFLIAIYRVFIAGLGDSGLSGLYPFIHNPGHLNTMLFGLVDLTKTGTFVLPIAAGLLQGLQVWMLNTKRPPKVAGAQDEDMAVIMNRQMMVIMPIMTAFIGYRLPCGLALYWMVNVLITVAQQLVFLRKHGKKTVVAGVEVRPPAPAA